MTLEPVEYYLPEDKPLGLTYGHWTVKWWSWALSIHENKNPIVDTTGANARISNDDPNVFFLAGTLGGAEVRRTCEVSANKSILFPVINYEVNFHDDPGFKTDQELVTAVKKDIDDIINLETLVDGRRLPIYRISSDPPIFKLEDGFDSTPDINSRSKWASSDGYWVFLKPLSRGQHDVYFAGSCSAATRNVKASYRITVI